MFRQPRILVLLVFLFASNKLMAVEVPDIYQANVVVESQQSDVRTQAVKEALAKVFLKVGAKRSVLTNKTLLKAQKNASRYVSQYHYQKQDDELALVVSFNEDKVNKLFEQAQLALWGSLRPQVLLWIIDEKGETRRIIAHDDDSTIPQNIKTFSDNRGLPLILPLMDLEDAARVVIEDFWQYIPEQVQLASQRYFADTIIVMRVSDSTLVSSAVKSEYPDIANQEITEPATTDDNAVSEFSQKLALANGISLSGEESNNGLDFLNGAACDNCEEVAPEIVKVLDWHVYTQEALYTKQYHGLEIDTLISEGLSDITELIYQSYALLTSAEDDFVIEVKNVTSLIHDTKVFNFLTELSAVKSLTLVKATGDVRRYKVDLTGSKASFLASLKLNRQLTQVLEPQVAIEAQAEQEATDDESLLEEVEGDLMVKEISEEELTEEGLTEDKIILHDEFTTENSDTQLKTEMLAKTPNDLMISQQDNIEEENYHHGLKIILLGDKIIPDVSEMITPELGQLESNDEDEVGEDSFGEVEVIAKQGDEQHSQENVENTENNQDSTEDVSGLAIADENVSSSDDMLIKVKPNIPVFYWEQG